MAVDHIAQLVCTGYIRFYNLPDEIRMDQECDSDIISAAMARPYDEHMCLHCAGAPAGPKCIHKKQHREEVAQRATKRAEAYRNRPRPVYRLSDLKKQAESASHGRIAHCWVYFVQSVNGGPIKIGHAKNVASRVNDLEVSSPYRLKILATIPGNRNVEFAIHDIFKGIRLNGEWFSDTPQLAKFIKGLPKLDSVEASLKHFLKGLDLSIALHQLKRFGPKEA